MATHASMVNINSTKPASHARLNTAWKTTHTHTLGEWHTILVLCNFTAFEMGSSVEFISAERGQLH